MGLRPENLIPGFSGMLVFTCRHCGEVVKLLDGPEADRVFGSERPAIASSAAEIRKRIEAKIVVRRKKSWSALPGQLSGRYKHRAKTEQESSPPPEIGFKGFADLFFLPLQDQKRS